MPAVAVCGKGSKPRNVAGYFLLGLTNNVGFVIMAAGAKNVAEAGVALVYLANIVPSTTLKVTAPVWFDRVSYNFRLLACVALMTASFLCVALTDDVGTQLVGVALGSLCSGLGEASFLAMAHFFESGTMLAAWSSGTGLAGIVGYLWVILINVALGASFEVTILVALVWPAFWLVCFFAILDLPPPLLEWAACGRAVGPGCRCERQRYARVGDGHGRHHSGSGDGSSRAVAMLDDDDVDAAEPFSLNSGDDDGKGGAGGGEGFYYDDGGGNDDGSAAAGGVAVAPGNGRAELLDATAAPPGGRVDEVEAEAGAGARARTSATKTGPLDCGERLRALRALWVYMVPLFLVYFSEYAMQSGAWSAIGFPVTSETARKDFYLKANLAYQVGVFVSRSSAFVVRGSVAAVWTAPLLQTGLLFFFVYTAADHFVGVEWVLVVLGFVTGLFGGFVYVNAFTLIASRVPDRVREFSLTTASMADSFGIIASDLCALWIQACLYAANGIVVNTSQAGGDARVQCPFEFPNATVPHNTTTAATADAAAAAIATGGW